MSKFKEVAPLCVYGDHNAVIVSPDQGREHWRGVHIFFYTQTWTHDQAVKLIDWLCDAANHYPAKEGWKMVPVEPTQEMAQAAITIGMKSKLGFGVPSAFCVYRAMLAAVEDV